MEKSTSCLTVTTGPEPRLHGFAAGRADRCLQLRRRGHAQRCGGLRVRLRRHLGDGGDQGGAGDQRAAAATWAPGAQTWASKGT